MNVLVAGVGNVFFGDDGFGPAVARELALDPPFGVRVDDYGIRSIHLAYELIGGYERAIVIDAVRRGGVPGTLYVIEPDAGSVPSGIADGHRMDLESLFAFARALGGTIPPLLLVGCEPAETLEGIGLSAPVAHAAARAVELVRELIDVGPAAAHRRAGAEAEGLSC